MRAFVGDGIAIHSTTVAPRKLFITDSASRNNGDDGISLDNNHGPAPTTAIERTRVENNAGIGFRNVGTGTTVVIRHSTASGNFNIGFESIFGAVLNIDSCVSSKNGTGVLVYLGTVRVSNSIVTDNASFGFFNLFSSTFQTRGNNMVSGNNGGGVQTTGGFTTISGT